MSTPIRAALWNSVALLKQIRQQHRLIALWAVTTHAQRPAEKPAGFAAALADEALLATRTLIDRVGCEPALALQLTAEVRFVRCGRFPSAKSVGELLVRR
jgi:hypothetical protein